MPRISAAALADRRRRIVDAARVCLARGGPAGVTTRAVAAEAGISTGALYHHFPSLDALWNELAGQEVVAGIGAAAARAPAGEDPLAWAVRALVCAPPLGAPERPGAPPAPAAERVVRATLDEVLRAAAAAGGLRRDVDAEALAEVLQLLWAGVDRGHATGTLRTSGKRLADVLVAVLAEGVRPPTNG